jgi:ATP-dependent exoDNAse (exonuclease V) beta subunit
MAHLIRQRQDFVYPQLFRVDAATGRTYKVPGFEHVPSVTTLLDRTKDKAKLQEWVDRVGHEEAERIKREAAYVGTTMHETIEAFLADEPLTVGQDWLALRGHQMAFTLINQHFRDLEIVFGSEVGLHYDGRYAGTTDMVAQYRGKLAIVDFKQALKPKRAQWITDYYHQLAAYACAHDRMFGTKIELGVILVAVQDGTTQEFTTTGREFEDFKAAWWDRVSRAEEQEAAPPSR